MARYTGTRRAMRPRKTEKRISRASGSLARSAKRPEPPGRGDPVQVHVKRTGDRNGRAQDVERELERRQTDPAHRGHEIESPDGDRTEEGQGDQVPQEIRCQRACRGRRSWATLMAT